MTNTHIHYNHTHTTLSNGTHTITFKKHQHTPHHINQAIQLLGGTHPTYTYTGGNKNTTKQINHHYYQGPPEHYYHTRTHTLSTAFQQQATLLQAITWETRPQDAEKTLHLHQTKQAHIIFSDYSKDHESTGGNKTGGAWVSNTQYSVTPGTPNTPVTVGESQMVIDAINAHQDGKPIIVFTDSLPTVLGFAYREYWRFEGLDGAKKALEYVRRNPGLVYVFKVKGHAQNVGNELVDSLAFYGRRGFGSSGLLVDLPSVVAEWGAV